MNYSVSLAYEAGVITLPRLTMFETDEAPTDKLTSTSSPSAVGSYHREGIFATQQDARQAIIRDISEAADLCRVTHNDGHITYHVELKAQRRWLNHQP